MDNPKCILCGNPCTAEEIYDNKRYNCANCGEYIASNTFEVYANYLKEDDSFMFSQLSGYAREMYEKGKPISIASGNFETLTQNYPIPKTPKEKLDKLLLWYYKRTEYFGQLFPINTAPAICYATNNTELDSLYAELIKLKYLDKMQSNTKNHNFDIKLTIEGHSYCEELLQTVNEDSKQAFIAMWFDDFTQKAYEEAIEKAVKECGFEPFRVDLYEHNNDITDEIIGGIRKSRFMIADLTGYRGGVYYEAGFASGLGIPVILTCHKDWFDGNKEENKKVHFDVNHINIIVWDNEKELKDRIYNRIAATII